MTSVVQESRQRSYNVEYTKIGMIPTGWSPGTLETNLDVNEKGCE